MRVPLIAKIPELKRFSEPMPARDLEFGIEKLERAASFNRVT